MGDACGPKSAAFATRLLPTWEPEKRKSENRAQGAKTAALVDVAHELVVSRRRRRAERAAMRLCSLPSIDVYCLFGFSATRYSDGDYSDYSDYIQPLDQGAVVNNNHNHNHRWRQQS